MELDAINVCLTGAAGQIAYALIPHLINGSLFDKPINLYLLDIECTKSVLDGVVMEIEDYASPHIASTKALFYKNHPLFNYVGIHSTIDPLVAFKDCDVAILVGAMPRKEGMLRRDLLKANAVIFKIQGQALDRVAHKTVKVIVVGNPANTNAFIVSHYAKSIPKENFSALTRLDQNRAHSVLAKRLGVRLDEISGVIVWGNHSMTMFPDISHVKVNGKPLSIKDTLGPEFIENDFIPIVQNRGSAVIAARKLSSAMSAAKAIADQLRSWLYGTKPGEFVSMAVISDGSYGSPKGTFFSFPCRCEYGGKWEIVQGLEMDENGKARIERTSAELMAEREEAEVCLVGSPDLETRSF